MPKHQDFERIYKRFIKQYGSDKGKSLYFAWLQKKGYDDTKPFPKKKEKKEKMCSIVGVEIKESGLDYHVEGLIASSHVDLLDQEEGIDIPDMIPKETLESFAEQMNTLEEARVMGVHHSEGNPINPEYFGKADIDKKPATVIPLSDGEWGLDVDTKLLKNDPKTPEIIKRFEEGDLNSFSITYDTKGYLTTDFDWVGDKLVRVLNPETRLFGYTAASKPVNPNAIATGYGYKEFKELVGDKTKQTKEDGNMKKEQKEGDVPEEKKEESTSPEETPKTEVPKEPAAKEPSQDEGEQKEFQKWKDEQKNLEQKEALDLAAEKIATGVLEKMEIKEKVLKEDNAPKEQKEIPFEIKEFREAIEKGTEYEIKEQFRRAAAASDHIGLNWQDATTSPAEGREYKNFGVNGRKLEFKGLGITTNQNTDTDYLQSSAELQDIYDPIIYNALNQEIVAWNLFAKDDYSSKGNNQVCSH